MSSSTEWSSVSLLPARCLGSLCIYEVEILGLLCSSESLMIHSLSYLNSRIATISKSFCPLSLCILGSTVAQWLEREVLCMSWFDPPNIFLAMFSFLHPAPQAFNFLADAEKNFPPRGPNAYFAKQTWPLQLCREHWSGSSKYSHGLLLWQGEPCAPLWPYDQKDCQP